MTNPIKAKSSLEALEAVNKAYSVPTPPLPPPKPGTESLPRVHFHIGLLYITQEAKPESAGVARAWYHEYLRTSMKWPAETITAFFESRYDQPLPVFHFPPPEANDSHYKLPNPFMSDHTHPPRVPDWGGFFLAELSNWYLFFTSWYLAISSVEISDTEIPDTEIPSAEIPRTDRRRRPEQIKNIRKKRSPDEKTG
jgi:hypothetical protein